MLLSPRLQRQFGDAGGLGTGRGADAQLLIHYRRIPQQQLLGPLGRAAVGDRVHLGLDQLGGQLGWIGDGGGAEDEARIGAVEAADAPQAPSTLATWEPNTPR